jgi:hypothetical protein
LNRVPITRRTGLGAIHFALDVPVDRGSAAFLDWLGGFYETYFSMNPRWTADVRADPAAPGHSLNRQPRTRVHPTEAGTPPHRSCNVPAPHVYREAGSPTEVGGPESTDSLVRNSK